MAAGDGDDPGAAGEEADRRRLLRVRREGRRGVVARRGAAGVFDGVRDLVGHVPRDGVVGRRRVVPRRRRARQGAATGAEEAGEGAREPPRRGRGGRQRRLPGRPGGRSRRQGRAAESCSVSIFFRFHLEAQERCPSSHLLAYDAATDASSPVPPPGLPPSPSRSAARNSSYRLASSASCSPGSAPSSTSRGAPSTGRTASTTKTRGRRSRPAGPVGGGPDAGAGAGSPPAAMSCVLLCSSFLVSGVPHPSAAIIVSFGCVAIFTNIWHYVNRK